MSKVLYEIKNGVVTKTCLDKEELDNSSNHVNYLCISDMFEGIDPAKMDDEKVSIIDSYFTYFKANRFNGSSKKDEYFKLICKLFNIFIESKDIDDLCNVANKSSFYNTLKKGYEKCCKDREIEAKVFDNDKHFISTVARMVVRAFIDESFDRITKTSNYAGKSMNDNLKIGSKPLYTFEKSRVYTDSKLNKYISTLYKDYMNKVTFDGRGHLCGVCNWKYTTDCPKVTNLIVDGRNIAEPEFNFITDARQLININPEGKVGKRVTTDYCVVTGCRLYPTFQNPTPENIQKRFELTRNVGNEGSKNFYRK